MGKGMIKSGLIVFSLVFAASATAAAKKDGSLLGVSYAKSTVFDISDAKGKTFFTFMKEQVKPALDEYAQSGFVVANGATVKEALDNVDSKVARGALQDAGSADALAAVADKLSTQGKISFYQLPDKIKALAPRADRYGLSTFLALASGGGVAVKLDDDNVYYNVNYGAGDQDKDEMTGRSFGEAPQHLAADASDKFYLQEVENYIRGDNSSHSELYRTILQILTNNDVKNLSNLSPLGQTVATDFFTIYTAEQDRHLMANLKSHAWDVALLQVTLLSAFHDGQDSIMVMFNDQLTDTTLKQAPGGEPRTEKQKASLTDYWQFSSNPDPKSAKRSGINVTKRQFQALGKGITTYERAHGGAQLIANVERHFKGGRKSDNVFTELTDYLISFNTAESLADGDQLADDFVALLDQVRKDANAISKDVIQNSPLKDQ